MIVTHTFNPSIDITYDVDHFDIGEVHRPLQTIRNAGGKGINVTKVLKQLGEPLTAYMYLGGKNGEWISNQLQALKISTQIIKIDGDTRQCIAVNDGQKQTEILEQGPTIGQSYQKQYQEQLAQQSQIDVMTINGSSPKFEQSDAFTHTKNILLQSPDSYNIVDIRASELKEILAGQLPVNAIKPNETEFQELVGHTIDDEKKFLEHMKADTTLNDIDIFLTLGARGALVKYDNQFYRATVPKIEATNPVGSGDSTVAGIAYGIQHFKEEPQQLIAFALACGMSNATQEQTGHIDIEQVKQFAEQITVEMI